MDKKPGCGDCGSVGDRVKIIQQVSEQLMGGHLALANLYKQLASEQQVAEERRALTMAAKLQTELADLSKFVTLPELMEKINVTRDASNLPLSSATLLDAPR